jgi:hypothetical protein
VTGWSRFREENVFSDVDDLALEGDFRAALRDQIDSCKVMLFIIGPEWLKVSGEQGARRLDDPDDYVRIELEAGLRREGLVVIPVLVHNAPLPASFDLPPTVRDLVNRNSVIVRDDPNFIFDVKRLVQHIERHLTPNAR